MSPRTFRPGPVWTSCLQTSRRLVEYSTVKGQEWGFFLPAGVAVTSMKSVVPKG